MSPTQHGGNQGWSVAGSCDGSIGPTSSPSFGALSKIAVCPKEYSSSSADYEAGDLVAVTVSISPLRQVVYECKSWPDSGYCDSQAANMGPGTYYGSLGWTLKGACDGTNSPTVAPSPYGGACTYTKCVEKSNCIPGLTSNGNSGSSNCSCDTDDVRTSSCKQTVCTTTVIKPYSSSVSYDFGDVVRVGLNKFRCREHPYGLWCRQKVSNTI